ncbi:MAG: Dolichyl-diphosphooligosaccharide-protein glycosyltransferase subunit dad1 [Peltula sp. TS41687]|nr:MAG: Dolichyl-diphosphooligosaccharide-protein glycosyltransferase subunit dad1 [Peltula sp. TS41687]
MPPKRTNPSTPQQRSPSQTSSASNPNPNPNIPSSRSASVSQASSNPISKMQQSQQQQQPQTAQQTLQYIYNNYVSRTPIRTKLLDAFLAYLVVLGLLQFVYCVLGGGYPFNAFLAGFVSCVGQFVLTVSLRIQMDESSSSASTSAVLDERQQYGQQGKKMTKNMAASGTGGNGTSVSNERAFADYIFCSLLLHFFCVNFIN